MRTLLIAALTFCTFMLPPIVCCAKDAPSSGVSEIAGNVKNIGANKSATVKMQISSEGNGTWRTRGEFDNKRLFGRFDVPGRTLSQGDDYVSIQFVGDAELGPEGDWEPGTKSSYVMTICFTKGDAEGVYDIGKLPGYDFHQYGTLVLSSSKDLVTAAKSNVERSSETAKQPD